MPSNSPKDRVTRLEANADIILEELAKLEPGDNEVAATHSLEFKAIYENRDFSVTTSSETSMYGVRSIIGGRQGFATTNADAAEVLRGCAREAQGMARFSTASEHHQLPAADGPGEYTELVDDKIVDMNPQELMTHCQFIVDACRKDDRIAVDRIEFSKNIQSMVVKNSKGVHQTMSQASCNWFVMGMARSGDEVTSFDYDGSLVSEHSCLEAELERTVSAFVESALGSLGAKPAQAYTGKVLLHPSVVGELLGGVIEANCDGLEHIEGTTQWQDKLGERVGSELLSVFEDPHNRAYPAGWMMADREGVPTAKHTLLDAGKLGFIAYDCYSAHRAGVAPTGNAQGGARSLPGTGFSNIVVAPAGPAVSEHELYKQLGTGLVLKRFSGNDDTTSGHFSGTAKNSWWVEGGERSHAVTGMMVSGNLFDLLNNVIAVGDVQHLQWGSGAAPYVLVDGVSVTTG